MGMNAALLLRSGRSTIANGVDGATEMRTNRATESSRTSPDDQCIFTIRRNIEHFSGLAADTRDPAKRLTILKVLAEEMTRLRRVTDEGGGSAA
jgi:hypothetical protein